MKIAAMFPPMTLEKTQCCDIIRSEDKSYMMSTAEAEDDPERT